LIKDLAITFNGAETLTAKDIAAYWKRNVAAVRFAAAQLDKAGVLKINDKGEMKLTKQYRKFFNRNPELALAVSSDIGN
jgi:hypothetical protein